MSCQEISLVERVKRKEAEALGVFIDQHRDELTRFIRTITGEHLLGVLEIDDLVQEVSTAALAGLETAPLDRFSPMEWLKQIARRRVVDAHRFHFQAQRRDANRQESMHAQDDSSSRLGLERLLIASITSASEAFSNDHRMQRVQEAIRNLTEEQQTVIRLRYGDSLPTKTIAEQVGKTDVAVRVLLSRTLRHLEQQLRDVRPTR